MLKTRTPFRWTLKFRPCSDGARFVKMLDGIPHTLLDSSRQWASKNCSSTKFGWTAGSRSAAAPSISGNVYFVQTPAMTEAIRSQDILQSREHLIPRWCHEQKKLLLTASKFVEYEKAFRCLSVAISCCASNLDAFCVAWTQW